MLLVCINTNVSAIVGAADGEPVAASWRYEEINGYKVYWMNNKYIRFYVLYSDSGSNKNTYLVTTPARSGGSGGEAYDMVFNKGIYQRVYFTKGGREISYDSREIFTESADLGDGKSRPGIRIKYTLGGNKYKMDTFYFIEKLDEGVRSGFSSGSMLEKDSKDKGRTYGIHSRTEAVYVKQPGYIETPDLKYCVEMKKFSKMGHTEAQNGAAVYMNTAVGNTSGGFTNNPTGIPGAMSRTKTNKVLYSEKSEAVTEIMTRGYSWANPFTATSDLYRAGYIEGFTDEDSMPDYFSTTVNGDVTLESGIELMGAERPHYNVATLWGFRDLYASDEDDFTPTDDIEVSISSKNLGIYKDGNSFKAIPAKNEDELKNNNKSSGEPVAVIRGEFTEENQRYVFNSGVASLSPTITAVWPQSTGEFSVGKDGSINVKEVDLNTPTFKFYSGSGQGEGLAVEASGEGLEVKMDPASNRAIMAIDIPGTTVMPRGAVIKPNGNISFTGEVEFQLFPGANFNIEELGYGYKGTSFKVNGIKATGKIDTAEMIGLEMGKIEGEIDTFRPYYHFTMELNVFDLFESNAELELKRSKLTGSLMPNKLYFYAGSDLAKIPLVPPVVVAYIKGAGGGFDGLADTFNGDFFAIPPITLTITGKGEVLNVLEAKASYTFGPAYYKFEAEDVGISFMKKLDLIDEFTIYEGIQGETRNYQGVNYTGLNAMGGASVHISVPKDWEVIQAKGSIDASVFTGLDNYTKPNSIYANADLNGGVRGSLHIPKDFPWVGGLSLGSTGFDFYLGAKTVMNVRGCDFNGAVNSLFKNFKVYGGVKKEADWKIVKYRVYYIFPENDIGLTVRSIFRNLPEWNWDEHKPSGYSLFVDEETGATGVYSVNISELNSSLSEETNVALLNGSYSKNIKLEADEEGQTLSKEATVAMMVTPKDGTDINEFAKSISVSKDGTPITLVLPEYNEENEITNENELNVYITQNAKGKDCIIIGLGEGASVGDEWNVASSLADFGASLNASEPFDGLEASLLGNTLTGSVENPDSTAEYVLLTYLGNEQGKREYLIEQRDITDPADISVEIPAEGTMLPTGDYYVSASLMRKGEVEDGGEKNEILLPVDNADLQQIHYTNTMQPDAPSSVTINPKGNEIMNASWNEVASADGYKVSIYRQKDDGTFEDTGKGYVYSTQEIKNSKVKGLTYDQGNISLDMALTVGGDDIGEDGASLNTSPALSPETVYKVGVEAYNCLKDGEGNTLEDAKIYGTQTMSNESLLPKYTPKDFDVTVKTLEEIEYRYQYVEKTITEDENGILTCASGTGIDNLWCIGIAPDSECRITRNDTGEEFFKNEGFYEINNSNIEGSVMLKIEVTEDRGTYADTTTKYLLIEKDNTPPVLSLDDYIIYADKKTGKYTITGKTEANAAVYTNSEMGLEKAADADENGNFSMEQNLVLSEERYDMDEEGNIIPVMVNINAGELVTLYAADANGNLSAPALATVTVKQDAQTLKGITVTKKPDKTKYAPGKTFDPAGMVVEAEFNDSSKIEITDYEIEPSGALTEGTKSVKISYTFANDTKTATVAVKVGNTQSKPSSGSPSAIYAVAFDSNGGSKVSSQSVTSGQKAVKPQDPVKEGFVFKGWYKDKDFAEEYDFETKVSKSITLYAKWETGDADSNRIIFTVGKKTVKVFGREIENDVEPVIINSRTMIPARIVAESLGAKVEWFEKEQKVVIYGKHLATGEDAVIEIIIGNDTAKVNSKEIRLDSAPFIENGRTYTPLRFISENLGAKVEWIEAEQKVIISK